MLDYPITPIADGLFYALTLIATAALTISAAIYRQKTAKYTLLLLVNLAVALLFYILIIWQESASVSLNSHQLQLNLPFYQDSINQFCNSKDIENELAHDLIAKLCKFKPNHRYNTQLALNQPWITRKENG